jgi:hypothetical protein
MLPNIEPTTLCAPLPFNSPATNSPATKDGAHGAPSYSSRTRVLESTTRAAGAAPVSCSPIVPAWFGYVATQFGVQLLATCYLNQGGPQKRPRYHRLASEHSQIRGRLRALPRRALVCHQGPMLDAARPHRVDLHRLAVASESPCGEVRISGQPRSSRTICKQLPIQQAIAESASELRGLKSRARYIPPAAHRAWYIRVGWCGCCCGASRWNRRCDTSGHLQLDMHPCVLVDFMDCI